MGGVPGLGPRTVLLVSHRRVGLSLRIAACRFCVVDVLSHVLDVLVCSKAEVISLDSDQQEVLGMTSCLNSQGRCFPFT